MSVISSGFGSGKTNSSFMYKDPITNGSRTETDAILLRFAVRVGPMIMTRLKPKSFIYASGNPEDLTELLHPASFRFLQAHGEKIFEPPIMETFIASMVQLIEAGLKDHRGNDRLAKAWAIMRLSLGPALPVKQ